MDPKPRPNRERYIQTLRAMTSSQRAQKFFELSDLSKRLFIHGLRKRFPDISEPEFKSLLLDRLAKCHNRNY